jgi:hypothetical protein
MMRSTRPLHGQMGSPSSTLEARTPCRSRATPLWGSPSSTRAYIVARVTLCTTLSMASLGEGGGASGWASSLRDTWGSSDMRWPQAAVAQANTSAGEEQSWGELLPGPRSLSRLMVRKEGRKSTPSGLVNEVVKDSDTVHKAQLWQLIFIKIFITT